MIKTETQIAEENIENKRDWLVVGKIRCREHKTTCQRDVPKLEKIKESIVYVENELCHHLLDEIIEDKKQAIKLYEDAGIK